jgi:iron complex outermembrane receptor protein
MVAGAVFLDAEVSGEAVDLGIIGPKPVGTTGRIARANFDYRLPFFDPVSVDLGITNQAGQTASVREYAELGGRQLMTEPQTLIDIGARYRFKASGKPVTLRAQITNLFDTYRWKVVANSSFRFIDARRFLLNLAADLRRRGRGCLIILAAAAEVSGKIRQNRSQPTDPALSADCRSM